MSECKFFLTSLTNDKIKKKDENKSLEVIRYFNSCYYSYLINLKKN